MALVVTRTPLGTPPPAPVNFPWEGTSAPVGFINGNVYSRLRANGTTASWTAPSNAVIPFVQSNSGWSVVGTRTNTNLDWYRFYCSYSTSLGKYCEWARHSVTTTSYPTFATLTSNRSGSCLVLSFFESGRRAVFQARPTCEYDGTPCFTSPYTSVAVTADANGNSFDGNGEDTIVFSRRYGANILVSKITAACGPTFGPDIPMLPSGVTSLPGVTASTGPKAHLPVRVGNAIGLLYVDASGTLRLQLQQ